MSCRLKNCLTDQLPCTGAISLVATGHSSGYLFYLPTKLFRMHHTLRVEFKKLIDWTASNHRSFCL